MEKDKLESELTAPPDTAMREQFVRENTARCNAQLAVERDSKRINMGEIGDGYHTFDELYEFRKMYNAALFNEWAMLWNENKPAIKAKYDVHKSIRHNDGELCFGGGWFVVVAVLPDGQITNHYKMEDWDLFKVPEVEKALYPYDNHTGADVLQRLKNLWK